MAEGHKVFKDSKYIESHLEIAQDLSIHIVTMSNRTTAQFEPEGILQGPASSETSGQAHHELRDAGESKAKWCGDP